ncbi:hypothetical protein [Henriciella barbarensis]|uniref:hypothetical protein n=1 Tax=Henriciella barbarensis TaxID=86342 RepID=UPI0015F81065|nr:hypothetical protein [Henriciella barbarensis]
MIARDWILDVLAELELWYWPIFLWELYWLDRYLIARRAENRSGLVGYSVCRKGRIYITLQAFGDQPDPNDWTAFAPRQPWDRLPLDASGPWQGIRDAEFKAPPLRVPQAMYDASGHTLAAPFELVPP